MMGQKRKMNRFEINVPKNDCFNYLSMYDWCFRLHCKANTRPGTTWANGMNVVIIHAPGAGSIVRPVAQQSSALPLYLVCPL